MAHHLIVIRVYFRILFDQKSKLPDEFVPGAALTHSVYSGS